MIRPTVSQAQLIAYFAGIAPPPAAHVTQGTYRVCRSRGWIAPVDTFPFHRATADGLAAIGASGAGSSASSVRVAPLY